MDWIESFQVFTEGISSPALFRKWTGISIIAGALQRRVWLELGQGKIYPNLYTMLIAPPGIGKTQAINQASQFWRAQDQLHVAADSLTAAALVDSLEDSNVKFVSPDGLSFQNSHALAMAAGEFSVFLPGHDPTMLGTLTHLYDNPPEHREKRRGNKGKDPIIPAPSLNILAGAQPAFLSELLPEYAWGQGFTARLLMIYSSKVMDIDPFAFRQSDSAREDRLHKALSNVMKLYGAFDMKDDAVMAFQVWRMQKYEPVPTHSRLANYLPRRHFHVFKLAMISAASHQSMEITLEDFNRAKGWLLEAEAVMPDIFRDMAGRSDRAVMDDLHSAMCVFYARTNGNPVHESRVIQILSSKVPADKIPRVIEMCERSGLIERDSAKANGPWYIPASLDRIEGLE